MGAFLENLKICFITFFMFLINCILNFFLIKLVGVDSRHREASYVEYLKVNKELRKLKDSIDLINELRTKRKVYFCLHFFSNLLCESMNELFDYLG